MPRHRRNAEVDLPPILSQVFEIAANDGYKWHPTGEMTYLNRGLVTARDRVLWQQACASAFFKLMFSL